MCDYGSTDSNTSKHMIFFDDNLWPTVVTSGQLICDVRRAGPTHEPMAYDDANDVWFHQAVSEMHT